MYARPGQKAANAELGGQATLRAKDLTLQLLTFSKGGAPVKSALAVKDLIRELVNFSLRAASEMRFFDPEDLWPIEADDGQISQVMNNMIINADQAMPKEGRSAVSCGNVHVRDADVRRCQHGRYVRSMIEDGHRDPAGSPVRRSSTPTSPRSSGAALGLAT